MILKYNLAILISIFILGLSFNSCTTSRSISKSDYSNTDTLSYEKRFEFNYQFFRANQYSLEEKNDLSLSLFNSCLEIDPYSAATHYKVASIYLKKNDLVLAQVHAEKSVIYNSDNIWYLYLLGSIYSMNNEIDKAKDTFIKLIKIDPTEIDYYFHLADVYLKSNDYSGTINISNEIEEKFGISESISLQKNKLYYAQNKNKEAAKELINLSEAYPNNLSYKRLIAEFYIQLNDIDNAIIIYKDILSNYPNDGLSHFGLSNCYRIININDESRKHLFIAFKSDELSSDFKFNILITLLKNADEDTTLQNDIYKLSHILYEQYPDNPDIVTIYANFKLQKNELKEARKLLISIVKLRKDKYAIWEQLILLDNEFYDWEAMYSHSSQAIQYFPNQSFLYFFKGFSSFQLKDFNTSIKTFSFGLKLVTQKDPMRNDFLSYLGESYYQIGDKEEAYKQFDALLESNSENIMVLNNYAYYLSLDNENLDKAESMSAITIDKEPNSATYLDTYAWILFKQNKFEKALIYIERAIANDSSPSDVVLEHYGDILFNNNKIEDAVVQWINASKMGDGSGLLQEKIDKKLYFE